MELPPPPPLNDMVPVIVSPSLVWPSSENARMFKSTLIQICWYHESGTYPGHKGSINYQAGHSVCATIEITLLSRECTQS